MHMCTTPDRDAHRTIHDPEQVQGLERPRFWGRGHGLARKTHESSHAVVNVVVGVEKSSVAGGVRYGLIRF